MAYLFGVQPSPALIVFDSPYLSPPGAVGHIQPALGQCVTGQEPLLPPRGSRRAAPIACGGLITAHAVAGREYHHQVSLRAGCTNKPAGSSPGLARHTVAASWRGGISLHLSYRCSWMLSIPLSLRADLLWDYCIKIIRNQRISFGATCSRFGARRSHQRRLTRELSDATMA